MSFINTQKIGRPAYGKNKSIKSVPGYFEIIVNKTGPGGSRVTIANLQSLFSALELANAWLNGFKYIYIDVGVSIGVTPNDGGQQDMDVTVDYESQSFGDLQNANLGSFGIIENPDLETNCNPATGTVKGLINTVRASTAGFGAEAMQMVEDIKVNSSYTGAGCGGTATFTGKIYGIIKT